MPELPEVETVRRILEKSVVGKQIKEIEIRYGKILKNTDNIAFSKLLENEKIINIGRKGKFLIFFFQHVIMLSHLRMEGKYLLKYDESSARHDHIIFYFTDNSELRYNDTRKFGTMFLFKTTQLEDLLIIPPLNKLGPEPFDEGFHEEYFEGKIRNLNRTIKSVLLDQSIVSGIGNIYADEILFLSKIHPATNVRYLYKEHISRIIENSHFVLNKAIEYGGTTVRSFKASDEISGRFQNYLLVHTKEICPGCGSPIKKERVAGRGTYFCDFCQKRLFISDD